MTTTSNVFIGDEHPEHDVREEREAAEDEAEDEKHPPDPRLDPGEARDTSAHAADPALALRAPQAVDGKPRARARRRVEQPPLGTLVVRLADGAPRQQLVQLRDLVGHRHQISRISRAGSSRASLMLTKNKTASRPSMMRWSYESAR